MIETLGTILPFLLPLLGLSVYSVGLILDKTRKMKGAQPLSAIAFSQLLDDLAEGRPAGADLPSQHPLRRLLSFSGEGPSMRQARAQALIHEQEDRLSYFPALANIATLTGLFGTVCGMISAFLSLRSGGGADPASLAGGLGVALFATAFGLVTAIPSLAAHALFQKRVQIVSGQMESLLSALLSSERELSRA